MALRETALDSDLARRARAGEIDAFELIVARHAPRVIGAAFEITRDRSLAEDAAQEAFWKAYRALDRYEERESLGAWLRTIAIRAAVDLCRRKRPETPLELVPEPSEESSARAIVDRDRLVKALALLRPKDRAILWLVHVEGREVREVAGALAMSETAVRVRAHRARKRLRKHFLEESR